MNVWTPSPLTTSALRNMHTNTGRILSLNPSRVIRLANKLERKHNVIGSSRLCVFPALRDQASPEAFNVLVLASVQQYTNSWAPIGFYYNKAPFQAPSVLWESLFSLTDLGA